MAFGMAAPSPTTGNETDDQELLNIRDHSRDKSADAEEKCREDDNPLTTQIVGDWPAHERPQHDAE